MDTFDINDIDTQKIIGEIHTYCNHILYSENDEWYCNVKTKEKIISFIEMLIDFYKSKNKSVRSLIHMKHSIEAGYGLKDKKYIEDCVQLLVGIKHDNDKLKEA
jgi:hypothetical protein